jgi:hypothetical protein
MEKRGLPMITKLFYSGQLNLNYRCKYITEVLLPWTIKTLCCIEKNNSTSTQSYHIIQPQQISLIQRCQTGRLARGLLTTAREPSSFLHRTSASSLWCVLKWYCKSMCINYGCVERKVRRSGSKVIRLRFWPLI